MLATTVFAVSLHAAAVDPDWSAEHALPKSSPTASAGGGVGNNMVVTPSGRVYVFYKDNASLRFTYTTDHGTNWTGPFNFTPVTPMPGGSGQPSVCVDANGFIHASWVSTSPAAVNYARLDPATGAWTNYVIVTSTPRYVFQFNQVTVDRSGRVHLFWQDGDHNDLSRPAEAWYARLTPGTTNFTAPVILSEDDGKHSAFPVTDLSGASSNLIAVAWRDDVAGLGGSSPNANWDIKMRVSHDAGTNWDSVITVVSAAGKQFDPQTVVDRNNVIHLAYNEPLSVTNSKIYIAHSDDAGATWKNSGNAAGFQIFTPPNDSYELLKCAYDYPHDIVWFFWKWRQHPGEDVLGTWVLKRGRAIETGTEFLTWMERTNSAGFHNFAVGADGLMRASYQIGLTNNPTVQPTIYYRERTSLPPPLVVTLTNLTLAAAQFQFGWDSEFAVSYQLKTSTNLTSWQTNVTPLTGTGGVLLQSQGATNTVKFFRVEATR